ncbi:MAG: hypothetical protein HBSAPP01_09570 [Candidatus Brocadia sapporoensis]|nr:MAG: hypothetical protein HBSAPP01_09570 [Candidatus Brocadia sapporoensis]
MSLRQSRCSSLATAIQFINCTHACCHARPRCVASNLIKGAGSVGNDENIETFLLRGKHWEGYAYFCQGAGNEQLFAAGQREDVVPELVRRIALLKIDEAGLMVSEKDCSIIPGKTAVSIFSIPSAATPQPKL